MEIENTNIKMERTTWVCRVVEAEKIPREYLVIDEKKLNTLAKGYGKVPVTVLSSVTWNMCPWWKRLGSVLAIPYHLASFVITGKVNFCDWKIKNDHTS